MTARRLTTDEIDILLTALDEFNPPEDLPTSTELKYIYMELCDALLDAAVRVSEVVVFLDPEETGSSSAPEATVADAPPEADDGPQEQICEACGDLFVPNESEPFCEDCSDEDDEEDDEKEEEETGGTLEA